MSSLVIYLTAALALILSLNLVDSVDSQTFDINRILDLLKKNQNSGHTTISLAKTKLRKDPSSDSSSDFSSDTSDDVDINTRIRKEVLIDFIEKVANANKYPKVNNKRYRNKKPNFRGEKYDNTKQSNFPVQLLDQIFSEGLQEEERKQKIRGDFPKKRLKPNRLSGNTGNVYLSKLSGNGVRDSNRYDDNIGLQDYSKVYIVLNSQAVRKSKNKESLNELISKVLALSSLQGQKDRQSKSSPYRYKGFRVTDINLPKRARRDSKDTRTRDSMDDDSREHHKPKRGRGYDPGRTAIPYIKHRGNIFEKDN